MFIAAIYIILPLMGKLECGLRVKLLIDKLYRVYTAVLVINIKT